MTSYTTPHQNSLNARLPTVAILDDHRVLRESLGALLEQHGFRMVLMAGTSIEFEAAIQRSAPDLALVDLALDEDPFDKKSGWNTVRTLRSWVPQVKVVILSGSRTPEDLERAREEGVAGYLAKDQLGAREVVIALRRILEGERLFTVSTASLLSPERGSSPHQETLAQLTHRELEVFRCIAAGYDNLKIAANLDISERTVRAHVSSLYRKLGSENRAQLALLGHQLGVRPPRSEA